MPAGVGHNSGDVLNKTAQEQLKSIIDRIEKVIDDELTPAKETIKEIYAEAKSNGYTVSAIRKLVALRGKDRAKVVEDKAILELYAHALGIEDLV